jgi:hypothetical protein
LYQNILGAEAGGVGAACGAGAGVVPLCLFVLPLLEGIPGSSTEIDPAPGAGGAGAGAASTGSGALILGAELFLAEEAVDFPRCFLRGLVVVVSDAFFFLFPGEPVSSTEISALPLLPLLLPRCVEAFCVFFLSAGLLLSFCACAVVAAPIPNIRNKRKTRFFMAEVCFEYSIKNKYSGVERIFK